MFKKLLFLAPFVFILSSYSAYGQIESLSYSETFEKAKVTKVLSTEKVSVVGTDTTAEVQTLLVEVLSGAQKGKSLTLENDYAKLGEGDVFYLKHQTNSIDATETWSVADPYRLDTLIWLSALFIALIFIFGGLQGVRGLASLVGSIFLIFYLLIPGIYFGYNAVAVSIAVASLIIILGSYITHGFNKTTTSAVISMIITVAVTGIVAFLAIRFANLSGFSSEEITYLNIDTNGSINLIGLLFGGIMIGLLGVLYDIAIGQAVAVEELFRAGKGMTRFQVYTRGIRIGREHIGALVNTLAIAYVGASLPLLLLIQNSTINPLITLNSEVFATEIIRILVGSIGLILAVPITTLIASFMLQNVSAGPVERVGHHRH